jgi:Cytochrome C oxidase, cbb3-type, subunit III
MKHLVPLRRTSTIRWRLLAPLVAAAAITACGGGGGGGASANLLSGVAVDGYLQGATVFLDLNRNGVKDTGEPATTTDSQGRYTLDYSSVSGSVAGLPIVVTDGIDSDTGYAFAGRLSAPADLATSAQVVSPLTTLVDAMVAQGMEVSTARAKVATALGLSSANDLLLDPLANLVNQPAIYTQQVALQRAVQFLASANQSGSESAHDAQERILRALAVAVRSQTNAVSVGQLVSSIAASHTASGKELAEAIHDAVEAALRRPRGHSDAKAVLKALDQLRHKMEGSRNYNLAAVASLLDTEYRLTTSTPFTKLVNARHDDDDESIGTLGNLFIKPTLTLQQPANTTGRLLASNCFQCHGTGGVGGFDKIRGSEASEIREFLTKPANSNIMAAHAQGYTPAQLDTLIAYLKQ